MKIVSYDVIHISKYNKIIGISVFILLKRHYERKIEVEIE
jgi:hypothetical protein